MGTCDELEARRIAECEECQSFERHPPSIIDLDCDTLFAVNCMICNQHKRHKIGGVNSLTERGKACETSGYCDECAESGRRSWAPSSFGTEAGGYLRD